jgi:hypothetical protein
MSVPPAEILTTTVLETVVGGVRVHSASNSPLGTVK